MKQTSVKEFVEDDGIGDFLADTQDEWRYKDREDGEGGNASPAVSFKVAGLVQHVLRAGVGFDYADVLVEGVKGVLELCGLNPELTTKEGEMLRVELMALGGVAQTREMARMVPEQGEPRLMGLRAMNWSLKAEEAFRKAFLASLRRKHRRACVCGRSDVDVAERLGLMKRRDVMPSPVDCMAVGEMAT